MTFKINKCVCCNSEVETILNLGEQPLANNLSENITDSYESYELKLNLCFSCYHGQLSLAVDPKKLYENYLYVSGTSQTLHREFKRMASFLCEKININNPKVLDIASNDGTFLKYFKNLGCEVVGIEPAKNIAKIANNNSIKTINCFFGTNESRVLLKENKFNLITAFNVLAHIPNPLAFIEQISDSLESDGIACIQTSQKNMFYNGEFDTIYHEHHYFYSIKSMCTLAAKANLYLKEMYFPKIHGNSYLFIFSKNKADDNSKMYISNEKEEGRYTRQLYYDFYKNINKNKHKNLKKINEIRELGYEIIGYGAAAKAIVLLNYYDLKIEYIIDENTLKHDKIIPKLNTKIFSIEKCNEAIKDKKICFVILAWNFADEISRKIRKSFGNVKIIRLIPEFKEL